MKAAFFINPESHTVRKYGSVLKKCRVHCENLVFEISDFDDITTNLERAALDGCDGIFIEGGDGTIQGVLSRYMPMSNQFASAPAFVLLPGGMTNIIAKQIGVQKPNQSKIEALLLGKIEPTQYEQAMMEIEPDENIRFYGFLFSTGALPKGTRHCLDYIHQKGIEGSRAVFATVSHILLGGRDLRGQILEPSKWSLVCDDDTYAGEHIISIASTLNRAISGFHLFWGEEHTEKPINLTYVRADGRSIVRNVLGVLRKPKSAQKIARLKRDGFISLRCERAEITHDGPIVLDGEFLPNPHGKINLRATKPLRFWGLK